MYTIPENIKKIGINRELIDHQFSKTKMREFIIEEVQYVKMMGDSSVLLRLKIVKPNSNKFRNIVVQISKGKIRDDKINKLLDK